MTVRIIEGDALTALATLPARSVQCCVTSPPYFGLRDYGMAGQLGLEATPDEYVTAMVAVFSEVRRVLRDDGTLWLNIGDSYAVAGNSGKQGPSGQRAGRTFTAEVASRKGRGEAKPKDLIGIPWMLAFALRADGRFLRSDIIWAKPNPMPESVTDRPTSSHEHVFLATKRARYFYDADAVRQPLSDASYARLSQDVEKQAVSARAHAGGKTNGTMKAVRFGDNKGQGDHGRASRVASGNEWVGPESANLRNVWLIASHPFTGAHFAVMPPVLAERCIKAGSNPGDIVLDPFGGAGTTGLVADRLARHAILIELNPAYVTIARERIKADAPLLGAIA